MNRRGGITDVDGIRVGHYTDAAAATGCTAVLCEGGAVGGADVRGGAPGTRETDLLRPTALVSEIHAVALSGGSAFGLDAASGVMRYLEERGVGLPFGGAVIPIVPAAILFDLSIGRADVRPTAADGYAACASADAGPVAEGSVGAGTGATAAKIRGRERAVKGGVGTASLQLGGGVIVGALMAVNAVGGVYDADTGRVVAGPRCGDGGAMSDAVRMFTSPECAAPRGDSATGAASSANADAGANTTIGVVATNAALNKAQANRLASAGQDGIALAVRPAHLLSDGDTMFAMATGKTDAPFDINRILAAGAVCVSRAIVSAMESATGLAGVPSASELGHCG